jgi:hypothetical protein
MKSNLATRPTSAHVETRELGFAPLRVSPPRPAKRTRSTLARTRRLAGWRNDSPSRWFRVR